MVFGPLTPWIALGAVLALVSSFIYGHHVGASGERDRAKAAYAESLERAVEQAHVIAKQDAEISEYYEKWRTRTVVQVKEVTSGITEDCSKCGIGPDALGLLNSARGYTGKAAPHSGKPDSTVPTTPAPDFGQIPGFSQPLIGNQPRVLRLRHETQLIGGRGEAQGESA